MKKLLALALPLLALVGCEVHAVSAYCHDNVYGDKHCHGYDNVHDHHDSTTVVYTSANNGGGSNNNIIVIEEEPTYCMWDSPYYHDPEYCTFDGATCCMWLDIGAEETWCYYDYCGWELVSVYSYY